MTNSEIEEVIDAFVKAAVVCTNNDIDGVELHGTHGYLVQQSYSPFANHRRDKWGDPLLFARTIAERVRAAIGPNKILGFRISAEDFVDPKDGGVGHDQLCAFAADLVSTGHFDYLNHSEGLGGAHYARSIGNYRHKFGEFLPLTRNLRKAINSSIPVIGVGKIPTPDLAESALQAEDCDLVGMTRAQIADPDLVEKLQSGAGNRIRVCTGSNQGCFDRGLSITCFQNPEVGEEHRLKKIELVSEGEQKKILVIGGGPAGIKAAEIAAKRGHHVTLVEKGSRFGGRLNLIESMGDAANLLTAVNWIEDELRRLPVDIRFQEIADEHLIKTLKPAAIILATGATPSKELPVPCDDSIPVLSSDEAAAGVLDGSRIDFKGSRALFIDIRANYETALVIEALAKRGAQVTVTTPHMRFGANLGLSHFVDYLKILPLLGVVMLPSTKLVEINDGMAHLVDVISKKSITQSFDLIVAGASPTPDALLFDICEKFAPTKCAGDVVAPRSALEAFREGDRCGRTL